MKQVDLPLPAPRRLARRRDPATSRAAAGQVNDFLRDHYVKILGALEKLPAHEGTIYEIGEQAGMDHVAVARRMRELEDGNKVSRTGRERPSPSGRNCTVWRWVG